MTASRKKSKRDSIRRKSQDQPIRSWLRNGWFWGLILLLAIVLAYLPVWWAGYIWDDDKMLTANPVIVGPLGLKEIWTTSAANFYPLVLTTLWVEHALWGLQPLPYHLANVLMHGACAIVLWRVLRSLTVPDAWLGTALWALHPMQVETVAWVTELKNTQSCLFYLLSIHFFVECLKNSSPKGKSAGRWSYAVMLLSAALAMASKSSTVILPLVLCLCAWWIEGRWNWRTFAKTLPVFLISIADSLLSMRMLRGEIDDPIWIRSWPEKLATAGDVIWFYLGKLSWPHPLVPVYSRWKIDADDWTSYLPLLAVIIVLFVLWLKRGTWSRPVFFAFAYFIVALLPVLGLVNFGYMGYSFVADHFQYLASMGPLALAGALIARGTAFIFAGRPGLQAIPAAGILSVFAFLTWQQCRVYQNARTLWTYTLSWNSECWAAYYNLGLFLFENGQVDDAITHYEKALEIQPNFWKAHNNLGDALLQKGQVEEAMSHFRRALELHPSLGEAQNNIGNALLKVGNVDDAVAAFQKAVDLSPNNAVMHNDFGLALAKKGQMDAALDQFQKAVTIDPLNADAQYDLGNALQSAKRGPEAIEHYREALRIKPDYVEVHDNLGNALLGEGLAQDAIEQFKQSLAANPNDARAHNSMAAALVRLGRVGEAITEVETALKIDPNYASAQANLKQLQAIQKRTATPK